MNIFPISTGLLAGLVIIDLIVKFRVLVAGS